MKTAGRGTGEHTSLGQFADNIFSSFLVALAATASTEPWAKMNSEERRLAAGLFGVKASTSGWPTIDQNEAAIG